MLPHHLPPMRQDHLGRLRPTRRGCPAFGASFGLVHLLGPGRTADAEAQSAVPPLTLCARGQRRMQLHLLCLDGEVHGLTGFEVQIGR